MSSCSGITHGMEQRELLYAASAFLSSELILSMPEVGLHAQNDAFANLQAQQMNGADVYQLVLQLPHGIAKLVLRSAKHLFGGHHLPQEAVMYTMQNKLYN